MCQHFPWMYGSPLAVSEVLPWLRKQDSRNHVVHLWAWFLSHSLLALNLLASCGDVPQKAQRLWSNKFLYILWKQAIRWRKGTSAVRAQGGMVLTHPLLDISLVTEELNFETQIWRNPSDFSSAAHETAYFHLRTVHLRTLGLPKRLRGWLVLTTIISFTGETQQGWHCSNWEKRTALFLGIVLWNMPSLPKYRFPSLLLRNGSKPLVAREGYGKGPAFRS